MDTRDRWTQMIATHAAIMSCLITICAVAASDETSMRSQLDQRHLAWRAWVGRYVLTTPTSSIRIEDLYDNEPFREIVKLGPPAIPALISKVQQDHMLGGALSDITKWKFHIKRTGTGANRNWHVEEFPDIRTETGPPDVRRIWLRWWKGGYRFTEERFESLYSQWRALKSQGQTEEALQKYQRMVDLGIAVLPSIAKKLEHGDPELISVVAQLTGNKVEPSATRQECLEWWSGAKGDWHIPFPPMDPKAVPDNGTEG